MWPNKTVTCNHPILPCTNLALASAYCTSGSDECGPDHLDIASSLLSPQNQMLCFMHPRQHRSCKSGKHLASQAASRLAAACVHVFDLCPLRSHTLLLEATDPQPSSVVLDGHCHACISIWLPNIHQPLVAPYDGSPSTLKSVTCLARSRKAP